MNTAVISGTIRSVAESQNPLQTKIEFILTDFQPNKNGEAIDISEADNIIASIVSMPFKAHFTNGTIKGHSHALPVGTVTHAELVDCENPYILAYATIWRSEYKELDTFLRTNYESGREIGTSWELYYQSADERDGIKWLKNVIMSATTIVDNPSYGNRTPILALAETIPTMETNIEKLQKLESTIWAIWEMIQELYDNAAMADALDGIESMPETLRGIVDNIKAKLGTMATAETELTTQLEQANAEVARITSELETLKTAQAEQENARIIADRKAQLEPFKIEKSDESLLAYSEDAFTSYIADLTMAQKSVAETTNKTPKVPNIIAATGDLSLDEIAQAVNARG